MMPYKVLQGTYEMNDKKFNGKVAFVTGATSGIGQACALAFANAGAKVVCIGRNAEALKDVEMKVRDLGSDALAIQADLSLEEEAERAVDDAVRVFGGVDVLVNA